MTTLRQRLPLPLLIVVGYVAVPLVATAMVKLRTTGIDPRVIQASSGMFAAGDAMYFIGLCAVLSLAPTSLLFLGYRDRERLWRWVARGATTLGATATLAGLAVVLLHTQREPWGLLWLAGFVRLLASPALVAGCAGGSWLCPPAFVGARRGLKIATLLEALGLVGLLVWGLATLSR